MNFFTIAKYAAIGAGIGGTIGLGACVCAAALPVEILNMLLTTEGPTHLTLKMFPYMVETLVCGTIAMGSAFEGAKWGALAGTGVELYRMTRRADENNEALRRGL